MTKKDFFRLVIKLFGLYMLITIVFSVFISNVAYVISDFGFMGMAWLLLSLTIFIYLFVFLIYKPDRIITWLKLDQGFDVDKIEFQNFNNANILKLAVIVLGGFLIIDNIPSFLSHTLFAFKSSANHENTYGTTQDYIQWTISFVNIIIGYLLLTNYSMVSRFLKEKDKEIKTEE